MAYLPPKKYFGQHFLRDAHIAKRICDSLSLFNSSYNNVLEVGPGQGVLTQFLYERYGNKLHLVEIDKDLVPALKQKFPGIAEQVYLHDFLELPLSNLFDKPIGLIGNFPYNISSQILFKVIENRALVPEVVGMFQREVAQRVVASPGNKVYGLLSAWLQTFYEAKYLFTVNEGSFFPPPKVKSGVIRLVRKEIIETGFDAALLLQVIKLAFNQRRKTLRNALRIFEDAYIYIAPEMLDRRAETLSHTDFIELSKVFKQHSKASN